MGDFNQQLRRDNSSLQQSAQHPLRSFQMEEQVLSHRQMEEQRVEMLRSSCMGLQKRLSDEMREHNATKQRLMELESACRRLEVLRKVEDEIARYNHALQTGQQHRQELFMAGKKPKDSRVYGGNSTQNKFAFGSDQLQQLLDQHEHRGGTMTHGRRRMDKEDEQQQQHANQASQEEQQRAHFRRINSFRQKKNQDDQQSYDIFGNIVQERLVPVPSANPETENDNTIFKGLGQRSVHERTETDLRADMHFQNQKLWRDNPERMAPQHQQEQMFQ